MAARAEITVQVADRHTPIEPDWEIAVVADGHMFENDGRTFLYLRGGAAPCEITVQTPNTVDALAIDDIIFDIPATTEERVMGPFPPEHYNQDGMVYIDWEVANIAGVSCAVIRLPV